MILPLRLLAIRAIAALLLAITGLQAVPARAVDLDHHHGSAFDIASVEVSTAPVLRGAGGDSGARLDPLVPPPLPVALPRVIPLARETRQLRVLGASLHIPSPLAREIASLSLAPRPPPLA